MTRSMTAQAIVRQLVSPGKRPMTLVLLRTSSRERSSRLVDREPLLEPERVGEVDGERRQVVGQAGRGRGVLPAELAHQDPQPGLGLGGAGRLVERRPVGGPDAGVELGPLGQLGQHVPQAMDGAATAVGVGPQLADRPDEPGCPVGDDQQRAAQAPAR